MTDCCSTASSVQLAVCSCSGTHIPIRTPHNIIIYWLTLQHELLQKIPRTQITPDYKLLIMALYSDRHSSTKAETTFVDFCSLIAEVCTARNGKTWVVHAMVKTDVVQLSFTKNNIYIYASQGGNNAKSCGPFDFIKDFVDPYVWNNYWILFTHVLYLEMLTSWTLNKKLCSTLF